MRLIRALRDCKQRSLPVSRKARTVSKKTSPILHVLALFVRFCVFFLPEKPAKSVDLHRIAQKNFRFYAIPPLVTPPFACHRGLRHDQGTKNQPKVLTEVFSWTSARDVGAKMLVFLGLRYRPKRKKLQL